MNQNIKNQEDKIEYKENENTSFEMTDKDLDQVIGGYCEDNIECEACGRIFSTYDYYRAHRCPGKP